MNEYNIHYEVLNNIFRQLNDKLQYAVLRNHTNLKVNMPKDFDIIVDKVNLNEAKNIISQGFNNCGYLHSIIIDSNNTFTIVGFKIGLYETIYPLIFHIVTNLSVKLSKIEKMIPGVGMKLVLSDFNLSEFSVDKIKFKILSEDDLFLHLLYKVIYKRKEDYIQKIKLIYNKKLENEIDIEITIDDLKDQEIGKNEYLEKLIRMYIHRYNMKSTKYLYRVLKNYYFMVLNLIKIKKTPIIYFTGPDGAGKTTLYDSLCDLFDKLGIKYVNHKTSHYIYAGLTKFYKRNINKTTRNEQKGKGNTGEPRDRNDNTRKWKYRRLFGLIIALLDTILIGRVVNLYYRIRKYTVIIETSPYDIFVKRHRPKFRFIEKCFIPLIQKPTLGFLMTAKPEVINSRKPELTVNEIFEYYHRVDDLLKENLNDNRYYRVDTNDNPNKAFKFIVTKIFANKER